MDHPFSEDHKKLLNKACIKMKGESVYVKLDTAITKYTSRGTELESFTESELRNYTTEYLNEKILDLCDYMITSPKLTLSSIIHFSRSYFFTEVNDKLGRLEKTSLLIIVLIPVGILLLMLLFIPYILYVQSSLYEIYNYVSMVQEKDMKRWLEICRSSSKEIKASISDIKKMYGKESFELLIVEERQEEGSQKIFQTEERKEGIQTEDALFNKDIIEEQEYLLYNEQFKSKRKKEMFSTMSKNKTKMYLIILFLFTGFIGVFRVIDSLYSNEIQHSCQEIFNINMAFSNRSVGLLYSLFYFGEDMRLGIISSAQGYTLVPYTLSIAYEHEDKITKLRPTLTGKLQPIQQMLNIADSSKFCSKFIADDSSCSSIYLGIMEIGYKGAVMAELVYIYKIFSLFASLPGAYRKAVGLMQFQEKALVMILDLSMKFESKAFNIIFQKIFDIEEDWANSMKTTLDIKFSIYLILLVLTFFFLWKKMADTMRLDIMKTLGILYVLPTYYLRANPECMKIIGQSSMIN